mmetsp:Transcript_32334/g.64366  ORF Transcript_32334/g.64366 Transcript_32334/m.64366 type:complete len:82 (+) Transcript_32334:1024-1269(+)
MAPIVDPPRKSIQITVVECRRSSRKIEKKINFPAVTSSCGLRCAPGVVIVVANVIVVDDFPPLVEIVPTEALEDGAETGTG